MKHWFRNVGILLALGLGGAGVRSATTAAPAGKILLIKGEVLVQDKDAKTVGDSAGKLGRKLEANAPFYVGETIVTKGDGRVKIQFVEGSNEVVLGTNTALLIERASTDPSKGAGTSLSLARGEVRSSVNHKYSGKGSDVYEVKTPNAVAGVRGTIFLAMYNDKTGRSSVATERGLVAVRNVTAGAPASGAKSEVLVKPGMFTSTGAGGTMTAPTTIKGSDIEGSVKALGGGDSKDEKKDDKDVSKNEKSDKEKDKSEKADEKSDKQAEKKSDEKSDKQAEKKADEKADKQAEKKSDEKSDKQPDKQPDKQEKQADKGPEKSDSKSTAANSESASKSDAPKNDAKPDAPKGDAPKSSEGTAKSDAGAPAPLAAKSGGSEPAPLNPPPKNDGPALASGPVGPSGPQGPGPSSNLVLGREPVADMSGASRGPASIGPPPGSTMIAGLGSVQVTQPGVPGTTTVTPIAPSPISEITRNTINQTTTTVNAINQSVNQQTVQTQRLTGVGIIRLQ